MKLYWCMWIRIVNIWDWFKEGSIYSSVEIDFGSDFSGIQRAIYNYVCIFSLSILFLLFNDPWMLFAILLYQFDKQMQFFFVLCFSAMGGKNEESSEIPFLPLHRLAAFLESLPCGKYHVFFKMNSLWTFPIWNSVFRFNFTFWFKMLPSHEVF